MKAVVLLSGGMDSVTALYHASGEHRVVGALSFDYGSKHNQREIPFAVEHCHRLGIAHQIISLDFIGRHFRSDLLLSGGAIPEGHYEASSMQKTVVPFRNGIMLAIAAGWAESTGAGAVVIAAHGGDHAIYPDCREEFLQAQDRAIQLGTEADIVLLRPFVQGNKADIVRRGSELGIDYSRTWSCYAGGEVHCGRCGTCVERREAFLLAGISDPTRYLDNGTLPPKPE